MSKHRTNQKGFTILELMIATSVFSVILLLCVFGIIQIGRIYHKGVVSSRTQAIARSVSDDLVQSIQYGVQDVELFSMPSPDPTTIYDGTPRTIDVGNRRYTYVLGKVLTTGTPTATQTNTALKVEAIDANNNVIAGTNSRELLNANMWLSKFEVRYNDSAYEVDIQVVSGDQDQIEDADKHPLGHKDFNLATLRCKAETGSQFCAVSGLYTEAVRRL